MTCVEHPCHSPIACNGFGYCRLHNLEPDAVIADCDCCGERRPVTKSQAYGIETWACDECSS